MDLRESEDKTFPLSHHEGSKLNVTPKKKLPNLLSDRALENWLNQALLDVCPEANLNKK